MRTKGQGGSQTVIKRLSGIGVVAIALAIAAPASAQTTVLDFSGAICNGGGPCGNGSSINQSYGDSAVQDVSYRSFTTTSGVTYEPYLKYWSGSYGDLQDVVWGGTDASNYTSEIVFTPTAGYELSLTSFLGGCYQNRTSCQTFPYSIASVGGMTIGSGSLSPPSGGHATALINSGYFSDGIVLRWGPDGFDGGLDNITFDVRAIDGMTGGVPEPTTWALMIMGFGAVGGAMRRRQGAARTPAFA